MEFSSILKNKWWLGWLASTAILTGWGAREWSLHSAATYDPSKEKLIILDAENRLLKQMLGQVQGKVFIMSPPVNGGKYTAKLVWDESRQAGFIATTTLPQLPPEKCFKVFARSEKKFYTPSQALYPEIDGKLLAMFEVTTPVFKANEFRLAICSPETNTPPEDYLLIAR